MARDATPSSTLDGPTAVRLVSWGLIVWAAVAAAIRLGGHVLLSPSNPGLVAAFFAAAVPLMALVTYPVYRWLGLPRGRRAAAAALMSLPGMFLDVILVSFAGVAFPAMGQGAVVNVGAILLFGYALVLLTGFVPKGQAVG